MPLRMKSCSAFPASDLAAVAYWQRELPRELWHRTLDWLLKYGHRGRYESDLGYPRYVEDLALVARVLFPFGLERA